MPVRRKSITREKKIYDLTQLLEISKSLCSVLDSGTLIESILYICMCQMRVLGAGMYVSSDITSDFFELQDYYSGFDLDPLISYSVPQDCPLVELLTNESRCFTMNELKRHLSAKDREFIQLNSLSPSLVVPLLQKKRLAGILLLGNRIDIGDGISYSSYEKEQILNIASLAAIAINNAMLVEQATTDMMTHLKLKHYFFSVLADKIDTCVSQNQALGVLMLDIDHFKQFNDTYGHAFGDYVLTETARIISNSIRTHDLAARFGGEEFIVMLANTEASTVRMVAENIRANIERFDYAMEGVHVSVTISIGVAHMAAGTKDTPKGIAEKADMALYVSKNSGRNRVSVYDASSVPEKTENDK